MRGEGVEGGWSKLKYFFLGGGERGGGKGEGGGGGRVSECFLQRIRI